VQVTCERCAAVGVGKDVIAVAVRAPGKGRDGRKTEKRVYRAFYGVLREMAKWLESLESLGVTHVAMEAAGTYSMPAYYALVESDFEKVPACNAGHVKNVPGRKTDLADAEWLAQLLECGLLAGSFIPPADVKAVRDLVRYRAKTAQQRVSEIARLGGVLQDAGIKAGSVASSAASRHSASTSPSTTPPDPSSGQPAAQTAAGSKPLPATGPFTYQATLRPRSRRQA